MTTKVADDLVTRREAAELAGVHLNTIRLWESTGKVDTEKTESGVVMIPRAQIEAIKEARRDSSLDDSARIAALETENRMLREQLDQRTLELREVREQYQGFISRVLGMTTSDEESGTEDKK